MKIPDELLNKLRAVAIDYGNAKHRLDEAVEVARLALNLPANAQFNLDTGEVSTPADQPKADDAS